MYIFWLNLYLCPVLLALCWMMFSSWWLRRLQKPITQDYVEENKNIYLKRFINNISPFVMHLNTLKQLKTIFQIYLKKYLKANMDSILSEGKLRNGSKRDIDYKANNTHLPKIASTQLHIPHKPPSSQSGSSFSSLSEHLVTRVTTRFITCKTLPIISRHAFLWICIWHLHVHLSLQLALQLLHPSLLLLESIACSRFEWSFWTSEIMWELSQIL